LFFVFINSIDSLAPIAAVTPQLVKGKVRREEYERIAGISFLKK
jgi:hypothetical protein